MDLGVGIFSQTLDRSLVVDATAAFHYDHARLLFRQSQPQPDAWTFYLLPFQTPVYLVIAACFLVVFTILLAVRFCHPVSEEGSDGRSYELTGFDHSVQTGRCTEWKMLEQSAQIMRCGGLEASDEVVETGGCGELEGGSHGQDVWLRFEHDGGAKHSMLGRKGTADECQPSVQLERRQAQQEGVPVTSEDRYVYRKDLGALWEDHERQQEEARDLTSGRRANSVTEWVLNDLVTLLAGLVNRREFVCPFS